MDVANAMFLTVPGAMLFACGYLIRYHDIKIWLKWCVLSLFPLIVRGVAASGLVLPVVRGASVRGCSMFSGAFCQWSFASP